MPAVSESPSIVRESPTSAPPEPDRFTALRQRMVDVQLAARDITDQRVLDVMRRVPRHLFVPESQRDSAYADWPLQIGQKLLIKPSNVTPSPTARPLTPLEKLTPAADGKYYHVVSSGESLSWIAGLYEVSLNDLMSWNGLNAESILHPDQKLLLQVTPPATSTWTPGPPTRTPEPTTAPLTPTPTQTASPDAAQPTAANPTAAKGNSEPGVLPSVSSSAVRDIRPWASVGTITASMPSTSAMRVCV